MAMQLLPPVEKKPLPELPRPSPRAAHVPTVEQIRARAYQKYCARNGAPGNPIIDWLEAEFELRGTPRDPAERGERDL